MRRSRAQRKAELRDEVAVKLVAKFAAELKMTQEFENDVTKLLQAHTCDVVQQFGFEECELWSSSRRTRFPESEIKGQPVPRVETRARRDDFGKNGSVPLTCSKSARLAWRRISDAEPSCEASQSRGAIFCEIARGESAGPWLGSGLHGRECTAKPAYARG